MTDDTNQPTRTAHGSDGSQPRRSFSILFAATFGLMLTLAACAGIGTLAPTAVSADPAKNGDIIVQFDDIDLVTRPFTFTQPISGLAALQSTDLNIVTQQFSWGSAICSIEGIGCPTDNCFCGGNTFWNYSYWDGTAWQGYQVGASDSVISTTGAIEGYRWGEWQAPMTPATQVLSASQALDWLRSRQQADGGFGSSGASTEVMIAAGANRIDATTWQSGTAALSTAAALSTSSLLDYWASDAITTDIYANNTDRYASLAPTAGAGKLIVAVVSAGRSVTDFVGIDLVAKLHGHYSPTTGMFGPSNWDQAFGILGWTAAYTQAMPVPVKAVEVLASRVMTDGGWGFGTVGGSDTNATAVVMQALIAAGHCSQVSPLSGTLAYLQGVQNDDGGFPNSPGGVSDANSTAYVVQALLTAKQDPNSANWTKNGKTPIDFLLSLQVSDGAFAWKSGGGADQLATQQTIPALLNQPLALKLPSQSCYDLFMPLLTAK